MTKVLDHGYIRHVESWGRGDAGVPEAGIIEAARQSTQGSFRGWAQDAKLLAYLFNSKPQHATPFEFAGMVIEVQAPILVFREWQRHRTQSYNEMSARYSPLPDLNYIPSVERLMGDAGSTNRQAQALTGTMPMTVERAEWFRAKLARTYAEAEDTYQQALAEGVAKELARCCIPVGRYSRMRASTSLRNWCAFLTLRNDPKAQWEIRQYAAALADIMRAEFPQVMQLFDAR